MDGDTTEEDEDEETLKLQLARIEAKLRLKKLQKKNAGGATAPASRGNPTQPPPAQRPTLLDSPQKSQVQVPASPSSRASAAQPPPSPKSPSRVLLGIDKGLRGRDVSLRRAPQYRNGARGAVTTQRQPSPPRPAKSFSQRIAEERAREKLKAERNKTIENSRSKGFGLEGPTAVQQATHTFTSVISSFGSGSQQNNPFNPTPAAGTAPSSNPFDFNYRATRSAPTSFSENAQPAPMQESTDEAGFDCFSGLHLSRRTTPHPTVSRHLSSKSVYTIPALLKAVVSPDYEPPDVEGDWVCLATICNKSDPRNVGQNTQAKANGQKYMVMKLTDLKWEIDLFLFGGGFERFWKIPVGTVIALLNPGIMKPRQVDSGRFSLTVADDCTDNVIEIGNARDLGFCKSVKRDGKSCGTWVDKRHTHFCAYHVETTVKKARVGRAEINSMSKLFSPPRKGTSLKPKRWLGKGAGPNQRDDGLLQEGPISDLPRRLGGAGGNVFVAPGRTTASLLDDNDYLADGYHQGSKEERMRKRLVDSKRERELTKRIIAAQGRDGGLGTEYLRKQIGTSIEGKEERAAAAREREKHRSEVHPLPLPPLRAQSNNPLHRLTTPSRSSGRSAGPPQ